VASGEFGRTVNMLTQVFNLLLALANVLITAGGLSKDWNQLGMMDILFTLVAVCWIAGAIWLFFGGRLAWCGSLLGVGTMLASSLTTVCVAYALMPTAQDPTDGYGYLLIIGSMGVLISGAAMFGLIRLRKELAGKWK